MDEKVEYTEEGYATSSHDGNKFFNLGTHTVKCRFEVVKMGGNFRIHFWIISEGFILE